MKALVILAFVCVALADDCGYFSCACNPDTKNEVTYEVTSQQTRKAISMQKIVSYFDNEKCDGSSIYEHVSDYTLSFVSKENDTSLYTQKIVSNLLKITSEKAVTELGCEGVSVGTALNILSEEERTKCNTEQFVIAEEGSFSLQFDGVYIHHPEEKGSKCEMVNANTCAVIYPKRYVLIPMYISGVVITIVTIVVYAIVFRKGKKTLPITQPTVEEVVVPSTVNEPQDSVAVETEPTVPESVSQLEDAASKAASVVL